jgi:tetratricopeptide (TPR) repeat protein
MFELNLSLALLRIGWSVAGLERLEQFIAKDGPNAALLEMSGNAWEEEGQPARARRHYEDAVAAEPEYWPAYYRLGLLAAAEGRPEAAIVCFQTVLRSQQTLLPVFLDLAKAYEAAGNDAEALGVYQTAHRLFPDHPQVVNNLAWLLAKNPETLDSALQHAQAAVSIQPFSAAARDTLGWIYFQKEDFAEAHAQLNKAVLLDAYNPSIRYHRGMASWKLGEAERALRDFQKAESSALPYPEKELAQKMIKRTLRRPNAPAEPQTPGPARTASSLRPPQEAC